ncbi:MAG: DUF1552 domain-containing protein [Myxococcota bacterium]
MTPLLSKLRMNRRAFLASAGLGAGMLSLAPLFNRDAEAGGLFPKRLIIVYVPNWTTDEFTTCTGAGADYQLPSAFAALEPHKSKLLVVEGVDNQAVYGNPPCRGHQGTLTLLNGAHALPGNINVEGNDLPTGWASQATIDQFVASAWEGTTPFRSLELGVGVSNQVSHRTRISYNAPDSPVPPDNDVVSVWDRLFADLSLDPTEAQYQREAQLGTLGMASKQASRMMTSLPADDREKLQAHLDHVANIENRIIASAGAVCDPTLAPPEGTSLGAGNTPDLANLQLDMLTAALSCDLTRVATVMFNTETGGPDFDWILDDPEGLHSLSHYFPADAQYASYTACRTWYIEQYAALLSRLDAIPEGDGTMLDNCAVLFTSAMGNSWNHNNRGIPVLIGGSAGGYFDPGRFIRYGDYDNTSSADHGGRTNNSLLLSLAHAMDMPEVDVFGEPEYCTEGPLDELQG